MLHFPQLTTGVLAQWPLRRRHSTRAIANETIGGHSVRLADPQASSIEWTLPLRGLSTQEADAIGALFAACEGRSGSFVFLDPLGNLLRFSQDFANSVWVTGPLLTVTPGIGDPNGGTAAVQLINLSGATQKIEQTITAHGGYTYCISAWVRSASSGSVALRRTSGAASQATSFATGTTWK